MTRMAQQHHSTRAERAVVARQAHTRRRHKRRQARHETQPKEHNVRGDIAARSHRLVTHMPTRPKQHALGGVRQGADIET